MSFNLESRDDALWLNDEKLMPIAIEDLRERTRAVFALWKGVGESKALFRAKWRMTPWGVSEKRLDWIADGVIPRATISMLAGARSSGKSTLATELAVAAARPAGSGATWLGQPVKSGGTVAMFSGEDSESIMNLRLDALDPDGEAHQHLLLFSAEDRDLDRHLRRSHGREGPVARDRGSGPALSPRRRG